MKEGEDDALGAENGKKDPFSDEIDVDDRDFDRFRPFFGVFYDFEPTSSCFFRHRADIFVFFEIFRLKNDPLFRGPGGGGGGGAQNDRKRPFFTPN